MIIDYLVFLIFTQQDGENIAYFLTWCNLVCKENGSYSCHDHCIRLLSPNFGLFDWFVVTSSKYRLVPVEAILSFLILTKTSNCDVMNWANKLPDVVLVSSFNNQTLQNILFTNFLFLLPLYFIYFVSITFKFFHIF